MLTYLNTVLSDPLFAHIILLGGSILSEIVVALGIVLETPGEEKTLRETWGVWLVIGGVVAGALFTIFLFTYDEAIGRGQNKKIIALEQRLAPRELSATGIAVVAKSMESFHLPINVFSTTGSSESQLLANEIFASLGPNAGSFHQTWQQPIEVVGVGILSTTTARSINAASVLEKALNEQGIDAVLMQKTAFFAGDEECAPVKHPSGCDTLSVEVGDKP